MTENVFSLDPDAGQSLPYETYKLKIAKGGETNYKLKIRKGIPPLMTSYKAKEGEQLRDSDMRYIIDVTDNLRYRTVTRMTWMKDPSTIPLYIESCKNNILYFINTFCWTYDPRLDNPHIPFVTYPFQDDVITWCLWLIQQKEMGVIEKSRDMGATWMMEAVGLYMCLFFPGKTDYQLSLREDDVDNRSEDSLMGKLRYMLRSLPPWLQGGWTEKTQDVDNKMAIKIPDTGSFIRGQLTGGTGARGGRATRAFFDEFAFIEDSEKVLKAAGSLSPACLFLSTPNGMGNNFYIMASSPFVRKKTLHWTQHPLKNDLWMKKERAKVQYTDEIWAQEHDINYAMSTSERVYPQFKTYSADEYSWQHVQEGLHYEYDPSYDVYVGMDFGMSDPTSVVFAQIKPRDPKFLTQTDEGPETTLIIVDEYERNDMTVDQWADYLKKTGYTYRDIVGDFRSGNQRTPTGKTWIKYLGQHGIHVVGKYNTEQAPIIEMKRLLEEPGAFAVNKDKCPHTIKAFQNWAYPIDKKTGLVPPAAKPKHDQWSHCMKGMVYLVDYVYGGPKGSP